MPTQNTADVVATAPSRPIFAIFEGGGAKGVAHVGALQAVQENGLEIIGVAGTSAGALLAVLAAIGLEANDIMSGTDPAANIISQQGQTPIGLLGACQWTKFQRLLRRGKFALVTSAIFGAVLGSAISPRIIGTLLDLNDNLGHFSAEEIEKFVNQVIRDRLATIKSEAAIDLPIPDRVTFADLAGGWPTVVPLKIVVTDVDHGTLEIFDALSTPNVFVSEAVAASISIPLVFKPASIPSFRPGRFADGGLVSNLPIWGFAEEKLGYERENFTRPPVPIVGFSLGAPVAGTDPAVSPVGFVTYLKRLLYAALQGSQGTAGRFLDDVIVIPLESPLDMLAFDAGWEAFRKSREAGYISANRHLQFILDVKPDRIRSELQTIRDATRRSLDRLRKTNGKAPVEKIRVNLIRPFGARSLRVMESLHMEDDADDRLLLDRRGRGAAEAFRMRGLRVFRLGRAFNNPQAEFMTKYERALIRSTVNTVVCVPIFRDLAAWNLEESARPEPAGILTIDSDDTIYKEAQDSELLNMLVQQSAILYAAVSSEIGNG